jgi:exopolyphosphatase / guanosine-5'-triphosphate,3'-diphosphate pyrophosphatase
VPVAVIDIGTNTTRLLVAEVEDGEVVELERRTTITSLGQGVDASGRLAQDAMDRVAEAIAVYREVIDGLGAARVVALATSAMRDSENGPDFRDFLEQRFGIDARTISGDEEARLTFLGATSSRNDDDETVVIDIGGGSTEYVSGRAGEDPGFHVSTQMGSVRHTERFLKSDPPTAEELELLAQDVRRIVPAVEVEPAIAVAGTATSLGAIDGAEEVHGYRLTLASC